MLPGYVGLTTFCLERLPAIEVCSTGILGASRSFPTGMSSISPISETLHSFWYLFYNIVACIIKIWSGFSSQCFVGSLVPYLQLRTFLRARSRQSFSEKEASAGARKTRSVGNELTPDALSEVRSLTMPRVWFLSCSSPMGMRRSKGYSRRGDSQRRCKRRDRNRCASNCRQHCCWLVIWRVGAGGYGLNLMSLLGEASQKKQSFN